MLTKRTINIGLAATFLLCYMEWGKGNHAFVGEVLWKVITDGKNIFANLTHPVILSGLLGLAAVLYGAFANRPKVWINISGVVFLSLVVCLFLLAGALSLSWRMMGFALPFSILSFLFFKFKFYKK